MTKSKNIRDLDNSFFFEENVPDLEHFEHLQLVRGGRCLLERSDKQTNNTFFKVIDIITLDIFKDIIHDIKIV